MAIPYKIYSTKPEGFSPLVEVAGCCCEFENELLYLQRAAHVSQGNTWGVPAGKLEIGEDPRSAVIREVFEETGIRLAKEVVEEIGKLYVHHSESDFIWHQFYVILDSKPEVILNSEHQQFRWLNYSDASQLSLISGGTEALELVMRYINEKKSR